MWRRLGRSGRQTTENLPIDPDIFLVHPGVKTCERPVGAGTRDAGSRDVLRIALALLLVPQIGQAAPWSLRQALDYAHAHQPSLAAALARVEVARAQAQVPRAELGPKVTAAAELLLGTANNTTSSYATLGIIDVARVGGTPANAPISWRPEPSTVAGVAVHKELYDFGRLETQALALDSIAHAADEGAKISQLDLDLLVEESFYAVLGAKAVVSASDAAVTRSQAHRDLAQAKVTAQLWPPIELTRAEADLARFEVGRIRASGSLVSAQSVLAAAVGATEPSIDAGTDDVPLAEGTATEAPELRAARAELEAQHHVTDAIRKQLMPDLSVSGEITTRAGGASVSTNPTPAGGGWVPDVPNYDALVVLSWPLFDRAVDARVHASQRQERVRQAEIDEVAQQLDARVRQATVARQVADAALPALQRAVDAASANHAQAEGRFTSGLGTAVELSDAEALLTDAQIQLAIGQFQLSVAKARLARVKS
jgi:outer membrane protein